MPQWLQPCDHAGTKTARAATVRALAAEGRTAHADAEASASLARNGLLRSHWRRALVPRNCLTFDVRGLPQAGPLDGGVRPTRRSKEMTRTRRRHRRKRLAFFHRGTTLACEDFRHLILHVGPALQCSFSHRLTKRDEPAPGRDPHKVPRRLNLPQTGCLRLSHQLARHAAVASAL